MKEAQKKWAGAAVTARPEVHFRGEKNVKKRIEQTPLAQGSGSGCLLQPAVVGDRLLLERQEAGRGQQRIGKLHRLACGQYIARGEQNAVAWRLVGHVAVQPDGDVVVILWADEPAGDRVQGFVVVGRHTGSCVGCQSRNITIALAENMTHSGRCLRSISGGRHHG